MTHSSSYLCTIVFGLSVACVLPACASKTAAKPDPAVKAVKQAQPLAVTETKESPEAVVATGIKEGTEAVKSTEDNAVASTTGVSAKRGTLDKKLISEVVNKNRKKIRYCYEKELMKNPALAGQVKVDFTIGTDGSVIAAFVSTTTINNSNVESCVTNSIKSWVFPKPKGDGIVIVKYPFNFSS